MTTENAYAGSASLQNPSYWWYQARETLMREVMAPLVGTDALVLDVGSADGPSAAWLTQERRVVSADVDVRSLRPGGVCASAAELPFADGSFDVVAVFDVIEHLPDEAACVGELARVVRPGGWLLASVPAYQWAWSSHDVAAHHYRRYTRPRLRSALTAAGLDVRRCTHVFAATFPFFVAERVVRKLRPPADPTVQSLPSLPSRVERVLTSLSRLDALALRTFDLPWGSSVFAVAQKPTHQQPG